MKKITPLKAIRAKCLDCSGFHPSEVRNCESTECPLFTFRMGRNPNRRGIGKKFVCSSNKMPAEIAISSTEDPGSVYRWVDMRVKK